MSNMLASQSHAYIVSGGDRESRQDYAERITREINTAEPSQQSAIRTIIESDGAITREAVRAAIRDVSMTAFGGAPRVIVLSDAHTLTPEAGNALLKILEEPPEGVTFILLVPTVARVMPTLRSRARLVSINQPTPSSANRAEAFIRAPIAGRLGIIAGLDGRPDQLEMARELLVCAQRFRLFVFAQWLLPSFVAVEKSGNAKLLLEASALRLGEAIDV